jgi:hypothetical protein
VRVEGEDDDEWRRQIEGGGGGKSIINGSHLLNGGVQCRSSGE